MSFLSKNTNSAKPVLPGFEHIGRMWSDEHNCMLSKILPGEYYVTASDEVITTVLGSCISACIRDLDTGVGGMNHFMLPGDAGKDTNKWGGQDALQTRYGIAAMEQLINDILKQGARKSRLELKLFGGGKVLAMAVTDVGQRNIDFAHQFIRTEGLIVKAEDTGGPYPRKVNFFPKTGRVMIRRLRSQQKKAIADVEKSYEQKICNKQKPGSIDLFG